MGPPPPPCFGAISVTVSCLQTPRTATLRACSLGGFCAGTNPGGRHLGKMGHHHITFLSEAEANPRGFTSSIGRKRDNEMMRKSALFRGGSPPRKRTGSRDRV
ncbi:MAG: hypothetical protein CM15mP18_4220 [Methanobacteriota archaeon]|nr:MAG: hypothetical protein CM15mP18_4220 [Euryarchaeota archaeon]